MYSKGMGSIRNRIKIAIFSKKRTFLGCSVIIKENLSIEKWKNKKKIFVCATIAGIKLTYSRQNLLQRCIFIFLCRVLWAKWLFHKFQIFEVKIFLVKLINEKIEVCMSSDFGSKIDLIASLNHLLDAINNVSTQKYLC